MLTSRWICQESAVTAQLLANFNWQTYRLGGAFTFTICHYIIFEQVAYTM